MSDVIRHVFILGRVQGVGYRLWLESEANARGLAGWVRNRKDGSVEAIFAGSKDVVAAMVEKCRHGPGTAKVEAVNEEPAGPDVLNSRQPGERFSVLPTI
jgi:acylphosphatase